MALIFYLFLFAILIFDGIGIKGGLEIAYYLTLSTPLFLYLGSFIFSEFEFKINSKVLKSIIFFSIFIFISTIFSVDRQNSFQSLLIHTAIILIYIWVVNYRIRLVKYLKSFLIIIGTLFCILAVLGYLKILIPYSEFNFFNTGKYTHNHLGDYLGLVLILLLTGNNILKNRGSWIFVLLFIPFFIFSFSRTAYLSLSIVLLVYLWLVKKNQRNHWQRLKVGLFIIIGLSILIFFSTNKVGKNQGITLSNTFLISYFHYQPKDLLSNRDYYFNWGLQALRDHPIFGIGPDNYKVGSYKYSRILLHGSRSSMNIFIDYFSELGIVGGISFILLILALIKKGFSWSGLYLLLCFQTYGLHKFTSILLLFFVILALGYKNKSVGDIDKNLNYKTLILLSTVILLFAMRIFLSVIFYEQGKYNYALRLYPLNKDAIVSLVWKQQSTKNLDQYVTKLTRISSQSAPAWYWIGKKYQALGDKINALKYYGFVYNWNPFFYNVNYAGFPYGQKSLVYQIYKMEIEINNVKSAKMIRNDYLDKISQVDRKRGYN